MRPIPPNIRKYPSDHTSALGMKPGSVYQNLASDRQCYDTDNQI
jgi:hypothetical protein